MGRCDNTGTDNYANKDVQVRACLRGRSMRRRVYNPDRLKYPMKRIGKRGEGKFKRISWDEAYTEIVNSLDHIKKEYGNEAIYLNYGTGTLGGTVTKSWPPGKSLIARLMNLTGGYLNHYGDYSTAQIAKGLSYTYGGWANGNSFSDTENSKLIVQFGNNPAETRMSGGGLIHHLIESKAKSNARMIMIDPRYNDTAAGHEDQWIPIKPGTDAAFIAAMAHVMIKEDLVDQAFLDKYCVGYERRPCQLQHQPTVTTSHTFLVLVKMASRRRLNGLHRLPVFLSISLFRRLAKSVQPNRVPSIKVGVCNVLKTVRLHRALLLCWHY